MKQKFDNNKELCMDYKWQSGWKSGRNFRDEFAKGNYL